MTINATSKFRRDTFTWLSYISVAYFAYVEAVLGPLIPFLRSELALNYTVAGMHFSAHALGMIIAGFSADRIAQRWGRRATWWGGGLGMISGMFLLSISGSVYFTITSALMMGFFGGVMFIIVQAALADHHPKFRTISLTEANIAASLTVTFEPLFVGSFQRWGFGWRSTLWIMVVIFLIILWLTYRIPITPAPPAPVSHPTASGKKLPLRFWMYWLVLFFGVAAEWCVAFWGAEFLQSHVLLPKTTAVTLMSIFFAAAVLARFSASQLARRISGQKLLVGAASIAAVAFFPFWMGRSAPIVIIGLFALGFGIANFYPLALSLAMDTAPNYADLASARITIGTGAAIFILPLLLGNFADKLGIWSAFGIVAILLIVILILTFAANKMPTRYAI